MLVTDEDYDENHKVIVFYCEYQRQRVKKENEERRGVRNERCCEVV